MDNVAVGHDAGNQVTTGTFNTIIGAKEKYRLIIVIQEL